MCTVAVKLVALDIDGTVVDWNEQHSLESPKEIQATVHGLRSAGIEVILASGRMLPGTLMVADALGLSAPVICQQGCSIHEAEVKFATSSQCRSSLQRNS